MRVHWCENSSQRDLKFHKLHFSIHVFLHRSGEIENGILKWNLLKYFLLFGMHLELLPS